MLKKRTLRDITNTLASCVPNKSATCCVDLDYAGKEVINKGDDGKNVVVYSANKSQHLLYGKFFQDRATYLLIKKTKLGDEVVADTSSYKGKAGDGYGAYALDSLGRLFVSEHISEANAKENQPYFLHSSFFSGMRGRCFGMIKIEQGRITYIDNHSGHYKPQKKHLQDAVSRLLQYFSPDAEVSLKSSHVDSFDFSLLFGEDDQLNQLPTPLSFLLS